MRGALCAGLMLLGALLIAATPQMHPPALAAAGTSGDTDVALPQLLSETGLFEPGRIDAIAAGVRHFSPQYPLWSDGMTKRRWIALPAGTTIDATDEHAWVFPVGTRLWKEFRLNGRPVETRVFWRISSSRWLAGAYVWNAAGTDATLAPPQGIPGHVEVAPGRRHSIPSRDDCAACHGPADRISVLGFNALQLSTDRDAAALHAEPLQPDMMTLEALEAELLLSPSRPERVANPPRISVSDASTRAMLGYLAANCGICHDGRGEIAGFNASLAYRDVVEDGDAVVRRLVGQPTRWQVPGVPEGHSVLVHPGDASRSAVYVRMRSRSPSSQMAPLGSVVRDAEAVNALQRWIDVTLAPAH